MNKSEFITRVSCLLNRPTADDASTSYFASRKHEDLLTEFSRFLDRNKHFIGNPRIEILQGMNDKGADILISIGDLKVGFQIKSHFDVGQEDFSTKIKAQITDSKIHGLVKLYLLICAPCEAPDYTTPKGPLRKLFPRIRGLMSEMSLHRSSYVAVYGPWQCAGCFNHSTPIGLEDLNLNFQQWHSAKGDLELFLEEIKKNPSFMSPSATIRDLTQASPGVLPKRLDKLIQVLDWSYDAEQTAEALKDFSDVVPRLRELPPASRELLCVLVRRAKERNGAYGLRIREVEGVTRLSPQELALELHVLEDHNFVIIDSDGDYHGDPGMLYLRKWSSEWEVFSALPEFCEKAGINLKELIIELRFNLLDSDSLQ